MGSNTRNESEKEECRPVFITYVTKDKIYTTNPFNSNKNSRLIFHPSEFKGTLLKKGVKILVTLKVR